METAHFRAPVLLVVNVPPKEDGQELTERIFPPIKFMITVARKCGPRNVTIAFVGPVEELPNCEDDGIPVSSSLQYPESPLASLLYSLRRPSEDYMVPNCDLDQLMSIKKDTGTDLSIICGSVGSCENTSVRTMAEQLSLPEKGSESVQHCKDATDILPSESGRLGKGIFSTDAVGQWLLHFCNEISIPPLTGLGEGDSMLLYEVLSTKEQADTSFESLRDEITWNTMSHRGGNVPRLISIQGDVTSDDEGRTYPLYRHPADEQPILEPWSPTSKLLAKKMGELLGCTFNHALIQYYRGGEDYISEHSDKTIDVQAHSNIINLTFGAKRTLILREKQKNKGEQRLAQKLPLPHNSVFVLGWKTNRTFLHSIKQDKRAENEKSHEEKDFGGERISLTFRSISTFVHEKFGVFGQGSRCKSLEDARNRGFTGKEVSQEIKAEKESLLFAFSSENRQTDFNWIGEYNRGFDVVNFAEI